MRYRAAPCRLHLHRLFLITSLSHYSADELTDLPSARWRRVNVARAAPRTAAYCSPHCARAPAPPRSVGALARYAAPSPHHLLNVNICWRRGGRNNNTATLACAHGACIEWPRLLGKGGLIACAPAISHGDTCHRRASAKNGGGRGGGGRQQGGPAEEHSMPGKTPSSATTPCLS